MYVTCPTTKVISLLTQKGLCGSINMIIQAFIRRLLWQKGNNVRKYIKLISLILVFMLSSFQLTYAHNLAAISGANIDYSSWDAIQSVPAPLPTSPVDVPVSPEVVENFKEVEIARAVTFYELYASQANRNHNMTLAAKAIDYAVINNGKIFSFNDIVGARTDERGYKEATIFVGEEKRPGLGGGICQISSTVYMAAKKARLKIIERHEHSMPVTYCSRDDEATVSWGYLDFKFENNTGDPIRLEASCKGGIVTVIIYQRIPVKE